ncbi:Os01g0723301 [Oryza sativa Japonica Group]|uniref:Os01g0723301 protein n=1 Tax=Oryza sativa subsp. japonica TaxID=39947 RepID=A0A0P0V7L1_ORYSJ|nr:Os01g0723301 [Oryza sativa Japonica Group]
MAGGGAAGPADAGKLTGRSRPWSPRRREGERVRVRVRGASGDQGEAANVGGVGGLAAPSTARLTVVQLSPA